MIPWIDEQNPIFPPTELALVEPDGLLCAGGNLNIETLVAAYRQGIFPWYSEGQPILWWSPDPRMVLTPEIFHLSRSMKRFVKTTKLRVTSNSAFPEVISACASIARAGQEGTWITDEMQQAYCDLHQKGYAHSVEVWNQSQLVGGLYGIALGKVFFGESMFSLTSNASKLALTGLVSSGLFELIDCQQHTPHLESLGAKLMSRHVFLARVNELVDNSPVSLVISQETSSWMGNRASE
ncbi:leucyl/phenylalanyl-tRNA--protein transferase [Sansalvadorimonas sp. 2012CJ34-2]|uniref:Leucyl/phenylalanyl-tRNA--protein transferase n=1 Tax=Parendozoicomonas callyspongiae TaxID=2942213 RepID=A0ABT0PET7_9GAMM|nr:leucyl/phenylalanyl-tRNA--protein transferase [Sansalvadorimonas sp. 2012CJ34-2]MCL6269894.1 leucyl/phenylalanyl-tRNA--protein transferase [Sansalvadorimonas sp. 2012CJ34-2]